VANHEVKLKVTPSKKIREYSKEMKEERFSRHLNLRTSLTYQEIRNNRSTIEIVCTFYITETEGKLERK
jgi:hypothetical protein